MNELTKEEKVKMFKMLAWGLTILGIFLMNLLFSAFSIGFKFGFLLKTILFFSIIFILIGIFMFYKLWELPRLKNKPNKNLNELKSRIDEEQEIIGLKIMMYICIALAILCLVWMFYNALDGGKIDQEIQSEENWEEKVSYCENQNKKYYRNACWVQGNWDRQDGGWRYPLNVSSEGERYLGEQERIYGGYWPNF